MKGEICFCTYKSSSPPQPPYPDAFAVALRAMLKRETPEPMPTEPTPTGSYESTDAEPAAEAGPAGGPSAPAKTGRPRKAALTRRTARIELRLTPDEKGRVERAAEAAGRSASDYLRRRALGQPVVARADAEAKRALSRVGGNLNQVVRRANAGGVAGLEGEVRAVLAEVRAAVAELMGGAR